MLTIKLIGTHRNGIGTRSGPILARLLVKCSNQEDGACMTHALEGQGQRPWFSRQPPRLDHLLPCMDQRRLQFSKYLASSFISILRHGHPAHAHARLRARSTCARIGANFNDPASNYARNGPWVCYRPKSNRGTLSTRAYGFEHSQASIITSTGL